MIVHRRAGDRGHANHGWLDTHHTFSFGSYHDARAMGFRDLRVMNEDIVAAGQGFGTHPHRDMEIITYVLSGALEHKDSMGNGEVLHPGEFQHMSAGTGIEHSEFNPSASEPCHLYQIWVLPKKRGLAPSYAQKRFEESERLNRLRVVASPDARDGSLLIHQDVSIFLATLQPNQSVEHKLSIERFAWLQVLSGSARLNDHTLHAGDGASVSDERLITVQGVETAEIMLFDLC